MDEQKHIRFSQLLEQHLITIIRRDFAGKQLTPQLLRELRDAIKQQLTWVFDRSSHKLSTNALGWITNQFFKAVRINEDTTVNDQIVLNDYNLADLPYDDIELMRNLFDQTKMSALLEEEYQRRSQA